VTDPETPAVDASPTATEPTASGERLVVTSDELQASDVEVRVQQMRAATAPQMVRAVGEAPSQVRTRSVALVMMFAGLVGGLLGWGASELISEQRRVEQSLNFDNLLDCDATTQEEFEDCLYEPWYGLGPVAGSVAFLTPFAVVLGALLIGWEGISSRSGAKFWRTAGRALPILVGMSAFGAWLSSEVYMSMVDDVRSVDDLHLPRGIAWAIASCAIGFAVGAASRSGQRMLNGAIGGAVGGFVGGFVFDYIELSDTNGIPNRVVGLTLTGACVGLAIGLVEHARREHWLEIVSGGMAGKQFILYRDVTTIGSSPACDITLIKDTGIGAQHATLQTSGGLAELRSFGPSLTVHVNGTPAAQQRLSEGDLLQMGTTILRYRTKAEATPTLAAPLPPRVTRSP
jgi:pSer/pThr/pTyr-binding forkhead associated (FHA) protein